MTDNRKLRFGIMCDGKSLSDWQWRCVDELVESGVAEPGLIISQQKAPAKQSLAKKLNKHFLFAAWQRFFVKLKSSKLISNDIFAKETDTLECSVIKKGKFSEYFKDSDIDIIKNHELDFILRFGFGIIKGDILNCAKYGVWSFHHGDERKFRGQPAGFWEMYHNEDSIGGILQRITERLDGGIILKRWAVRNNKTSWSKNLDELRYAGAGLARQVCVDIQNGNGDYVNSQPSKTDAKLYFKPTNLQMLRFFCKITANRIKGLLSRIFLTEEWNIGIVKGDTEKFISEQDFDKIKWISNKNSDVFIADPFGAVINDQLHLFYEEYNYKKSKGLIKKAVVSDDGELINEQIALTSGRHFSYPYIFEADSQIYAVPEMKQSGKVTVYKVLAKSGTFVEEKVLLDNIEISDPSIFKHDGRWWLLGTIDEMRLCAWYSDSIDGVWHEHKNNPVKIDISSVKSGGTVFELDGQLIRPSQDCSKTYGGRCVLNRITQLTPETFCEETIDTIAFGKKDLYPMGPQTFSKAGDYIIVDGKRMVCKPSLIFARIARKARKLFNKPEMSICECQTQQA